MPVTRRCRLTIAAALAWLVLAGVAGAQSDNQCNEPGESPDVIVGDIGATQRWGSLDGFTAFSIATHSCNVGSCWLNWISGTNQHPVIGQNMYRLKDGRFEQIGQSWLKHGFLALSVTLCSNECLPTSGDHLGVNCSDPYSAGLNGNQNGLGPKFEVNATTGEFPYPATDINLGGDALYKRLQVRNADLNPNLNPGAQYFAEGQYVTADDAAAGNNDNNASYRQAVVIDLNGDYDIQLVESTVREKPAISVWIENDPAVDQHVLDVPGDGRFILASKVTTLGGGFWHYEYAVHNLNSHRSAWSFSVPIPPDAHIGSIGFHDVDYHSGEPFDGTDWTHTIVDEPNRSAITWTTEPFEVDPQANALRWGTLYNFRFDTNVAPNRGAVTLGLFRPGSPDTVTALLSTPEPCDKDGICDRGETCTNCADDCADQGGVESTCCGDGTCDAGETACSCAADCGPCLVTCAVGPDCDDGLFCNGVEQCVDDLCAAGSDPCPGQLCDDTVDSCVECVVDSQCDDGSFCNGIEICSANVCVPGADPCPDESCNDDGAVCVECTLDEHCQDGVFCNGVEICSGESCFPGSDPCPPDEPCDESSDSCIECVIECDDGLFCNGNEVCIGDVCLPAEEPCPGRLCNEASDVCEGNVQLQPQAGRPLVGLTPAEQARFAAGETAFDTLFDEAGGLGPVYNQASCGGCHSNPRGGSGSVTVTLFGSDDGGSFDPLEHLGGLLQQTQTLSPECAETLPAEANVTTLRSTGSALGAGLIEAIADAAIEEWALNPPAGVSGRVHGVEAYEQPGVMRVGRFGRKSQLATVLSASAEEARDEMGLTNRLLPEESAPNGDQALLAACDAQPDPEDGPDGEGFDFIDRVTDFQRLLAAPPQTPRSGMAGGVWFNLIGCSKCHVGSFITADDPQLEDALRNKLIKPYSDFLLHDMGQTADFIGQGEAQPQEMRTAPLWGLRSRERLWHDGRVSGGTFEERVLQVIALHDAPGSEAQAAAQDFANLAQGTRDALVRFLDSLGRVEFDDDGDGDVDQQDFEAFSACYHGPGGYDANDPCAVSDVDQNGTVDDDDYALFRAAYGPQRFGGAVPDGAGVPGSPLVLSKAADGEIALSWGASCRPEDTDYEIYEGPIGQFGAHVSRYCSTDGETARTFAPAAGSSFYLVVPSNGIHEGSYGTDAAGNPRPPRTGFACRTQTVNDCE